MEVLIGWKKTVLILMLLWILRMEPRCVSLLDLTCLSVSTRKISVCTGMMTSLQSLTRKQADKAREVLKRISNCIYLVSQSKLCFFKLISWMLHLIFHQGSIVVTVTQQCMWMLTQTTPQSWIYTSQRISCRKDSLLYLTTRRNFTNWDLYMGKHWRKQALIVICLS